MTQRPVSVPFSVPFPVVMGVGSRCVILLVMLGLAPLLPAPPGGIQAEWGWEVFSAWDSDHYQTIATQGYAGEPTAELSPLFAFFPLFPLVVRGLMALGLPFAGAGVLVSAVGFGVAVAIVDRWVTEDYGPIAARWAVTVLCCFPFSLFASVAYTEGLFLGLSSLTLYQFQHRRYRQAALWGALATATRITGLALVPALGLVAWKERRSIAAFFAAFAPLAGVGAYSLYCGLRVQNPLAFLEAQKYWQAADQAFWGQPWLTMVAQAFLGPANAEAGALVDPVYPAIVLVMGGLAWGLRSVWSRWGETRSSACAAVLVLGFWLLGGDPALNLGIAIGTLVLFWRMRSQLQPLPWFYSLSSLAIIFASGRTISVERHIYGMVTFSLALGLILAQYPQRGRLLMAFFGLLLVLMSLRFAQHLWVA
ncbi:MAG: mannosyltransferase family protein [Prochlorothrix sp.]